MDPRVSKFNYYECKLCGASWDSMEEAIHCANTHARLDDLKIISVSVRKHGDFIYLPNERFPQRFIVEDVENLKQAVYILEDSRFLKPNSSLGIDEEDLAKELEDMEASPDGLDNLD